MSKLCPLPILAVALLSAVAPAGRADDRGAPALSKEYLTLVRAETQELARSLERLQQVIVEELGGRKERDLYRQADSALTLLADFEGSLKGGATRAPLYAAFTRLDRRLHDLLEAADRLGEDARGVRREAARVRRASGELHYALYAGDPSEGHGRDVLRRQARRLLATAKDLEQTAQYALAETGGQVSPGDFRKLVEAAARFEKGVSAGAGREQMRKDFREVDRAWQRVIQVLKLVKPRENLHLVRSAAQMDRLHERIYRLLGLEGKDRPRLIIST